MKFSTLILIYEMKAWRKDINNHVANYNPLIKKQKSAKKNQGAPARKLIGRPV